MTVSIERPAFLHDKRCYEVKITSCDLRLRKEASTAAELPIEFSEDREAAAALEIFLDGFLKESKGFFSKPLDPDLFRYRTVHCWDGLDSCLQGQVRMRASWVPASVLFYSNRYEIHWEIAEFEELAVSENVSGQVEPEMISAPCLPSAPSAPPLSELGEMPTQPSESSIVSESAPPIENPPDLLLDAELLDTIPFEATGPIVQGPATRSRERQRVRRARLKAALAQLRAERLAERYYDRYGTLADIEGDSSLSSGSNSDSETPQKQV
jgi:hypothetical protein